MSSNITTSLLLPNILIYTRTLGFRHHSIPTAGKSCYKWFSITFHTKSFFSGGEHHPRVGVQKIVSGSPHTSKSSRLLAMGESCFFYYTVVWCFDPPALLFSQKSAWPTFRAWCEFLRKSIMRKYLQWALKKWPLNLYSTGRIIDGTQIIALQKWLQGGGN